MATLSAMKPAHLSIQQAWSRLPVVLRIAGRPVRWLGPLVDQGHEVWLDDMGQGAWGYLEGCGWADCLPSAPFLLDNGTVSPAWVSGLQAAADLLASQGMHCGPESDPDRWLSWICFAIHEPRATVQRLAEERE